ncbi:uncharacterized protein LOC110465627 [Mizuhopecten yessoensis]|nr:uncharacterized protein LOC110465627 [Mizuhopecten yessoensis]
MNGSVMEDVHMEVENDVNKSDSVRNGEKAFENNSRRIMVNTKKTPVQKCPMCAHKTADREEMRTHLMSCGLATMEKNTLRCEQCDFITTRKAYLKRHQKRHEAVTVQDSPQRAGDEEAAGTSVDDWQHQDPGDLIVSSSEDDDIESSDSEVVEKDNEELLSGRIVRKRTQPSLPISLKRPRTTGAAPDQAEKLHPKDIRNTIPHAVTVASTSRVRQAPLMKTVAVQTLPVQSRSTVTKTTRYPEGEKSIEIVEFDEVLNLCPCCSRSQ